MNYILAKKEEVGELFPEATQVREEIILPMSCMKVMEGHTVRIVSHKEVMSMIETLNTSSKKKSSTEKKK